MSLAKPCLKGEGSWPIDIPPEAGKLPIGQAHQTLCVSVGLPASAGFCGSKNGNNKMLSLVRTNESESPRRPRGSTKLTPSSDTSIPAGQTGRINAQEEPREDHLVDQGRPEDPQPLPAPV
jgi:hypothetical protein